MLSPTTRTTRSLVSEPNGYEEYNSPGLKLTSKSLLSSWPFPACSGRMGSFFSLLFSSQIEQDLSVEFVSFLV